MIPRTSNRPRRRLFATDRALARAVFFFFLALYTLVATGLPDHMDSEVEYQTTSALGRGRGFALGGTPESDALVAARAAAPSEPRVPLKVGRGGTYSWFGTGQALVGVPFYWMGKGVARLAPGVEARFAQRTLEGVTRSEYFGHLFVGLRNPLLGALCCWLVVLIALQLGLAQRWALVAGLGYGLTTFACAQARSTLSDVQATCALLAAMHLLLLLRARVDSGRRARPEHAAFAGALLGVAFLTRLVTAPAIAVLIGVAVVLLVRDQRRALWWFLGTAVAGLFAFLYFNWMRFGALLESGYGDVVTPGGFWLYPPELGLAGLLFSPSKGLLFLAPLAVLAPFAWRASEPGLRRLFLVATLLLTLAVFGPIVATETWHGAWTYGPRYVLPALPFLWLAAMLFAERIGAALWGRLLVGALLLFGFLVNLPGMLVDHMTGQDLAMQGARLDWPDVPGSDDARFQMIQWEPRYAAPWTHWRIFRHRIAGLGEVFSPAELFFSSHAAELRPNPEMRSGFRHLAWVDLESLGGVTWPLALFLGVCVALGWRSALQASSR